MNVQKEANIHKKSDKIKEKGDGTMSATTQNHVYCYGKKKVNAKDERIISAEKLKEIKEMIKKYRVNDK